MQPLSLARSLAARHLLQAGALLFVLGLLTGLLVPILAIPRLGLVSHLEGVFNGMLLLLLGLIWPRLRLGRRLQAVAFWLALYGTYANWFTTLTAALLGIGGASMPLAAAGVVGSAAQETLVLAALLSLAAAMLAVGLIVLWGLRGAEPEAGGA